LKSLQKPQGVIIADWRMRTRDRVELAAGARGEDRQASASRRRGGRRIPDSIQRFKRDPERRGGHAYNVAQMF
jgi:hypothetical protein